MNSRITLESMRQRWMVVPRENWIGPTLVYLMILLTAVLVSTPRRVGDGQEYMAMALNLAELRAPSLSPSELVQIEDRFRSIGNGYQDQQLARPELQQADGRQEFAHFWTYPALVAPFIALSMLFAIPLGYAFVFVNVALLISAFVLVVRRIPPTVALLIFVSPILWWTDKPAVEPFMFACIAITVAMLADRPWWSLVALGLAATQNPPVALVLPVVWIAAVLINQSVITRPRFLLASAFAGGLALVHPIYYLLTLGVFTPQVLIGAAVLRVPTWREFLAPLTDLNIGLAVHFPQLLVALVGLAIIPLALRARRELVRPEILSAVAMGLIFLFGFSQTTHFNGGTQGPTRYALWLIPLAVPFFARAWPHWGRLAPWAAVSLAAISYIAVWSTYEPATSDGLYVQPSAAAREIWANAPGLDNPIPEIFYDRTAHREGPPSSIGTPTCSKILLVDGQPAPDCPIPMSLPEWCAGIGTTCYANRTINGYEFVAL